VVDRGYNSFAPTRQEIFRLKRQQILANSTAAQMNGWVDEAVRQGRWLIEAFHGCDGEGWEPPPCAELASHYAYVAARLPVLWVATFSEIIYYIRERMAATVRVLEAGDARIRLELSDSLDNTVYRIPLTLRTEVGAGWTDAAVVQDNRPLPAGLVSADGRMYAQYEALPDAGTIEIRRVPVTRIKGARNVRRPAGLDAPVEVAVHDVRGKRVITLNRLRYLATPKARLGLAAGVYFLESAPEPGRFARQILVIPP
jgi:hypothetical protein